MVASEQIVSKWTLPGEDTSPSFELVAGALHLRLTQGTLATRQSEAGSIPTEADAAVSLV